MSETEDLKTVEEETDKTEDLKTVERPEEKSAPDSEADTAKVEVSEDGQDSPGFDPESATAEVEDETPEVTPEAETGPAVFTDELSEDGNPEEEDVVVEEEEGAEMSVGMDTLIDELERSLGRSICVRGSIGVIVASVAGALVQSRPSCAKREADILELAADTRKIVEAIVAEDW